MPQNLPGLAIKPLYGQEFAAEYTDREQRALEFGTNRGYLDVVAAPAGILLADIYLFAGGGGTAVGAAYGKANIEVSFLCKSMFYIGAADGGAVAEIPKTRLAERVHIGVKGQGQCIEVIDGIPKVGSTRKGIRNTGKRHGRQVCSRTSGRRRYIFTGKRNGLTAHKCIAAIYGKHYFSVVEVDDFSAATGNLGGNPTDALALGM